MALAVVLLTGAGLLIRSFLRVIHVDPGFRAANVLSVFVGLPGSRYSDPAKQAAFFCVCQLDLAPFDALIWPHLVFS
jgi:hypothetical protein